MFHLVYVSSSVKSFGPPELASLLAESRENNARLALTGLLLYHDGNFLQVLEGEEAVVKELYEKIRRDPRHQGVICVLQESVEERNFPDWAMAFRDLNRKEPSIYPGYSDYLNTPLTPTEFSEDPGKVNALLKVFKAGIR